MIGDRLRSRMHTLIKFAFYVARRFDRDQAASLAASLSYTSLLSLVPLMAVALAILAAFPVFRGIRARIEDWVFANFVPAIGEAVQHRVTDFIANAGQLSAAGTVGLAFTAVMLLVTIEGSLNHVFRVARARSMLNRLLIYWTVVTLGPLLIGASLSVQGYLAAQERWNLAQTLISHVMAPLPTLLSTFAFTLLLAVVPNRPVRTTDALVGGVAAGLLFAALRWGFARYIVLSGAYTTVYGAVAVVPIFLLWMFLSWAVVLIGAEITAALPEWRSGYATAQHAPTGERRLTMALSLLAELRGASIGGHGGRHRRQLLGATGMPESDLANILHRLTAGSLVATTADQRYLLARDLGSVSLGELVDILGLTLGLDKAVATAAAWRPRAEERLAAARACLADTLGVPLIDLLR